MGHISDPKIETAPHNLEGIEGRSHVSLMSLVCAVSILYNPEPPESVSVISPESFFLGTCFRGALSDPVNPIII